MKARRGFVPLLAFSTLVVSCGPSVTISRVVPAPYNLGPIKAIVLVESRGVDSPADRFAIGVVGASRQLGFYEVVDARPAGVALDDLRSNRKTDRVSRFRRDYPADVYAQTEVFRCGARMNSETYKDKEKDKDGNEHEVTKTRYWYAGECEAHVTLVDAKDGRELASFGVLGQDTSSKTDGRDTWRESIVAGNALSHAVDDAVMRFTPHRVTEAIDLDKKAPLAKEGVKLVDEGRYGQARTLWEQALTTNPGSAPLLYNLGAVCEALGDRSAARKYYREAFSLDKGNERYERALELLEQRARDDEALRRKR